MYQTLPMHDTTAMAMGQARLSNETEIPAISRHFDTVNFPAGIAIIDCV